MTTRYRILPSALICTDHGLQSVVRVTATGPDTRMDDAPIAEDLTLVQATLACGHKRSFGFVCAWIGSDLRMHVGPVNPRDTVQGAWERSTAPPRAPCECDPGDYCDLSHPDACGAPGRIRRCVTGAVLYLCAACDRRRAELGFYNG